MSKKIVAWMAALLLPLLLVGAGYMYYQYQSRQFVQNIIAQLAPVATIKTQAINVGFDGVVLLKGLAITPLGSQQRINIDSFSLKAPGPFDLLTIDRWLSGHFPSQLKLQFKSVRLPSSAMLLLDDERNSDHVVSLLSTAVCGDVSSIFNMVPALGDTLTADLNLTIESASKSRILQILTEIKVPGYLEATADFGLESSKSINLYEKDILSQAVVNKADLHVKDSGFIRKRNNYCSGVENVSIEAYKASLGFGIQSELLYGIEVEQAEFNKSVLALFEPNVDLFLRLEFINSIYVNQLFGPEFSKIITETVNMTVNNERGSTKYYGLLSENYLEEMQAGEVSEAARMAEDQARADAATEQSVGQAFEDVMQEQLAQYIGKEVRIENQVGRVIEGVLLQVEIDKVVLQRRVEQGFVKFSILKKNIASLKVK